MPVNSFDDYPMSWKPDLSTLTGPKYTALAELLERDIKSGKLKAGTKLPPQRELADFLDLNPSTISKVYRLCGQKGLLCASVGNGTYVSSDAAADPVLLCGREDPRMIEMGAIVPFVTCNQIVKEYTELMMKRPDALNLFSYGAPEGTLRQRKAGVAWLRKSVQESSDQEAAFYTDTEHIVLAAAGQNGLTAALGACFETNDKIGTEPMTYPGVKTAAKLFGIHLLPVRSHDHELTEEGIRYAAQNENIKGIYVIPDYQNPTSHTMSLETRKMIAAVAAEENLLVIEDGINSLLAEAPLPPIASFAPEQVIHISSLSKTVSPGLRTAFVHVPDRFRERLVTALYSMNICVPPLLATVSAALIEDGAADKLLAERKKGIMERNRIVDQILEGFVVPSGSTSPLRMVQLPQFFTGKSFEICAGQAGVEVYGAERFFVGNRTPEKTVRISVTTPPSAEILAEGLQRLRGLLSQ
ncbi:MAG: PLP-dependent aminotransferase family protein [Lachnospiraceae bacterium]|nr:PLP-dependent aminotransferase family protein [Lachnospiraceae bacterium]